MAYVNSATEGLNCLHAALKENLYKVKEQLGYTPDIVWNKSQALSIPNRKRIWALVMNFFNEGEDKRTNIGRPKKFEVIGTYRVMLHFDPSGVEFAKIDRSAELIKSFYRRELVRLRPYNVLSATVNDADPIETWNRKQITINYRFQYFE